MPYKRYDSRIAFTNNDAIYLEQFARRRTNLIAHYATPNITYPDLEELRGLTILTHIWKVGDRFYKISDLYYDDPGYWWILAWFNQKPLETDIKLGEVLDIPLPLDNLMSHFR